MNQLFSAIPYIHSRKLHFTLFVVIFQKHISALPARYSDANKQNVACNLHSLHKIHFQFYIKEETSPQPFFSYPEVRLGHVQSSLSANKTAKKSVGIIDIRPYGTEIPQSGCCDGCQVGIKKGSEKEVKSRLNVGKRSKKVSKKFKKVSKKVAKKVVKKVAKKVVKKVAKKVVKKVAKKVVKKVAKKVAMIINLATDKSWIASKTTNNVIHHQIFSFFVLFWLIQMKEKNWLNWRRGFMLPFSQFGIHLKTEVFLTLSILFWSASAMLWP